LSKADAKHEGFFLTNHFSLIEHKVVYIRRVRKINNKLILIKSNANKKKGGKIDFQTKESKNMSKRNNELKKKKLFS
jgi:hypothetical protein